MYSQIGYKDYYLLGNVSIMYYLYFPQETNALLEKQHNKPLIIQSLGIH